MSVYICEITYYPISGGCAQTKSFSSDTEADAAYTQYLRWEESYPEEEIVVVEVHEFTLSDNQARIKGYV